MSEAGRERAEVARRGRGEFSPLPPCPLSPCLYFLVLVLVLILVHKGSLTLAQG